MTDLIPAERIEHAILTFRGQRVMLSADLAALYLVETKVLNRAVKRNQARFPADFSFQLTGEEFEILRCQFGTSSSWGGRRYPPFAFTEQGVAMLSSVLHSDRAIAVNVEIMRAFVRMRRLMAFEAEIRQRFEAIEHKAGEHDAWITYLYQAIEELMKPPDPDTKRIGCRPDET